MKTLGKLILGAANAALAMVPAAQAGTCAEVCPGRTEAVVRPSADTNVQTGKRAKTASGLSGNSCVSIAPGARP